MFGTAMKPSYKCEPRTLEQVLKELDDVKWHQPFVEFLNRLDWSKTVIYFVDETTLSTRQTGYKVVHFRDKVTEKWHDAWQTWYGLSYMMS